jgi:hypothetical protein
VRRHGANVHLTLHRLRIATVFTRHPGFGAAARGHARGTRPPPTAPPRAPHDSSHRGDSADDPSSKTRDHSASKSSAPHMRGVLEASVFRAQGADPFVFSAIHRCGSGCDRLLEAHARGRPKDRGAPPIHMPLSPHARGITPTTAKPHSPEPRPTAPDTADRSTAWIRLAAPVATAWHWRVALGVPTLEQNTYRGETLHIYEVET